MDIPSPRTAPPSAAGARHALLQHLFVAAIACSALLMFLVQPMVGKALLPSLGGTPQVWNTCMVFFQAMLFLGYLHAHYTGQWLGVRRQAVVHLLIATAALAALPFGVSAARLAAPDANFPVWWLLKTLLLSVGAPIFVISATAPLLQKWFAGSGHPHARDPYFLYAASNAGSLLALLAYPVLVEPMSSLGQQWVWWSAGFGALVVLLIGCARLVGVSSVAFARAVPETSIEPPMPFAAATVNGGDRARWLVLSFAPSSLLLGVTTYITTDVAAVPLFWVVPLALYLLTFIIAFSRTPLIPPSSAVRAQALALTLLAVWSLAPRFGSMLAVGSALLHLVSFFLTALVCHGELVRVRPRPEKLTEFYLWMSLGGLMGGVFNALIAPTVFDRLIEYPLVLALACALRPPGTVKRTQSALALDLILPCALAAVAWGALQGLPLLFAAVPAWLSVGAIVVAFAVAGMVLLSFSDRPIRLAVGVGLLVGVLGSNGGLGTLSFQDRSFFGVIRVVHNAPLGINIFVHGSTVHGVQYTAPEKAKQPAAYYHKSGAFHDLFQAAAPVTRDRPVAIVGLGTGGLACYGARGSQWSYFEIDPLVERVARDERYFTFLRDCPPRVNVVIGDARVTLRSEPDSRYAMILIDAFTSDAIPTHLLTREAIAAYRQKLAPDGLIALHISNRHLTLGPVVGNLARDAGLVGRISKVTPSSEDSLVASPAQLVVLAQEPSSLGALATHPNWLPIPTDTSQRVWTDDHVDIVRTLFR
jgi:hypothetical protein